MVQGLTLKQGPLQKPYVYPYIHIYIYVHIHTCPKKCPYHYDTKSEVHDAMAMLEPNGSKYLHATYLGLKVRT